MTSLVIALVAIVSPHAAIAQTSNPFPVSLTVLAPDSIERGRAVHVTVIAENKGVDSIRLHLNASGDHIRLNVQIRNANQTAVWQSLVPPREVPGFHSAFVGAGADTTLKRGDRLELTADWDQHYFDGAAAEPGVFTIVGQLPLVLGPFLVSAPIQIRIY